MGLKAAFSCAAVFCGVWSVLGYERLLVVPAWIAIAFLQAWAFLTDDTSINLLITTLLTDLTYSVNIRLDSSFSNLNAKGSSVYTSASTREIDASITTDTRGQSQLDIHALSTSVESERDVPLGLDVDSQAVSTSSTPAQPLTPFRSSPLDHSDLDLVSEKLKLSFSEPLARQQSPSILLTPAHPSSPDSDSPCLSRQRSLTPAPNDSSLSAQYSAPTSRRLSFSQEQSPNKSLRSSSTPKRPATPATPATTGSTGSRRSSIGFASPFYRGMLAESGVIVDSSLVKSPTNLHDMQRMLDKSDPEKSHTDMHFDTFNSRLGKVQDESGLKSLLYEVFRERNILSNADVVFSPYFENLDSEERLSRGKPDFLDAEIPEDVRKHLKGGLEEDWNYTSDIWRYLNPSAQHRLSLPNFFIELKGPKGSLDECERQVLYYGAIGGRAIHKVRHHLNNQTEHLFDGKARTITVSIHARGSVSFYATHVRKLAEDDEELEYHSKRFSTFNIDNEEDYERWPRALENAYYWAKEMRAEVLGSGNQSGRASRSPRRSANSTSEAFTEEKEDHTPPQQPSIPAESPSHRILQLFQMFLLQNFAILQQLLVLFLVIVFLGQLSIGQSATPAVVASASAPLESLALASDQAQAQPSVPAEPIHMLAPGLLAVAG